MKVIEVRELTKHYGDFVAVNNISFEVRNSEIFGFLGPNGAGKTTTIRMLTGLLEPTSGEIRIFGLDVKENLIDIKERMGIVPEMANPYIDLTVMQNLKLVGKLYGMKKDNILSRSEELLNIFGIYEKRDRKVRTLSKGLKQRLSLAMALLPDPDILFLDEPTSGLDVMSARLIKRIITEENKKGKTVFLSTHNMHDANELCHRIAIINHGKIVAMGKPEDIKKLVMSNVVVEVSLEPLRFSEDAVPSAIKIEMLRDKIRIHTNRPDVTIREIVHYAEVNGIKILSLNTEMPTLEDVFVDLVGGENV